MLSCSVVYDTLLDILRTDKRGLALSIDEFNNLAVIVNQRVYAKYYAEFESSTANSSAMAGFKVLSPSVVTTITLALGIGTLPSNYFELIGRPRTNIGKAVDLVSNLELEQREDDYLTQPSVTHPCAILGELDINGWTKIRVYPVDATITSVNIDYLRLPTTPKLDYYTDDTTLITTYMLAGASVLVPLGSTYRDGTAGGGVAITSLTVNFEWAADDLALIIAIFCELLGIAYPDQILLQAGELNEQKEQ